MGQKVNILGHSSKAEYLSGEQEYITVQGNSERPIPMSDFCRL